MFEALISPDIGADLGMLGQTFGVEEISKISGMIERRAELTDNGENVLKENIEALRHEKNSMADDDISAVLAIIKNKKKTN